MESEQEERTDLVQRRSTRLEHLLEVLNNASLPPTTHQLHPASNDSAERERTVFCAIDPISSVLVGPRAWICPEQ